ncbi:MAG: hypothetical protein IIA00_03465 [Proteobacteria bacterium]|nr:hypothetical protein [Pseudomonadota bacterium]
MVRPVSEIDVFRSADALVKQHGDEAAIHAAMRADAMLDKGDLDGQRVWLRIVKAVGELLARGRETGRRCIEPVGLSPIPTLTSLRRGYL